MSLVVILLFAAIPCTGQQSELRLLEKEFDSVSVYRFQEKVFVHTDQISYLTGETLWFKAYLVERSSNKLSNLSKVVYLEMTDKNNEVVLKTKIQMTCGVGDGSVFLPTTLPSGNYNIVAYTQWMRNFSTDFYFRQTIRVINPFVKLGQFVASQKPAYDIQFFPEGGNLVVGLKSSVGFRAVGKNGKGIKFKGSLINQKNDTVAHFVPLKFGLGQFSFTPQLSQHYRAVVIDTTGQSIVTPMPDPREEGYVIHATDEDNFVKLEVHSKLKDTLLRYQRIYLFVQSKNVKKMVLSVDMINGTASSQLDKRMMGEGVNKIILFDQKLNPVCERSFFIFPKNKFSISAQSDKTSYPTRSKVTLRISPSRPNQSVKTLSISVYKIDSLALNDPADISAFLWLTSELKGTIESPGYYLQHGGDKLAIDNLMLSHGWSRFKWEDTSVSEQIKFIPEYGGQLFSGRVMNVDGTPAKGINTYLSVSGKDGRLYLSQSDEQGIVHFDIQDFYGTRKLFLQTNAKIDSTYRIELTNSYAENLGEGPLPEFELSRKLAGTISERSLAMQLQYAFSSQNQTLLTPKSELPFYGAPDERYLLDDFTRFPTMEEVMREYVKGVMVRKRKDEFHFLNLDRPNNGLFTLNPLVLLDGVPVFDINKIMAVDPRKIQKLDVITRQYYLGRLNFNGVVSYFTYDGGMGDYIAEKANISFVDGLQSRREFFSPVYETPIQAASRIPDRRHLLLWSPHVKADNQGNISVPFFTSDVIGNYHTVVQVLSPDGDPSVAVTDFKVEEKDEK